MIKYYEPEELTEKVKYTVRGTYLFGDDKVVIESKHTMHGNIYGYDVLKKFVSEEPDFIDVNYKCVKGGFVIDEDYGGLIRVLDDDGTVIYECCDIEELQEHLVGVEIVKIEKLEDDE